MESLPSELREAIIRLSLSPTVPPYDFRDRYDALMSYSLVARSWRTVAQNEMLRHLWVQDAKAEKQLDNSPLVGFLQHSRVQSVAFGYGIGAGTLQNLRIGRFMEHVMLRLKHAVTCGLIWNLAIDRYDFYALEGERAQASRMSEMCPIGFLV